MKKFGLVGCLDPCLVPALKLSLNSCRHPLPRKHTAHQAPRDRHANIRLRIRQDSCRADRQGYLRPRSCPRRSPRPRRQYKPVGHLEPVCAEPLGGYIQYVLSSFRSTRTNLDFSVPPEFSCVSLVHKARCGLTDHLSRFLKKVLRHLMLAVSKQHKESKSVDSPAGQRVVLTFLPG